MTKMKSNISVVKLKDLCASIQYGYTASATSDNVGPKFLRITDIVKDYLDWSNVPFCHIPLNTFEKYRLHEGDIVIARTGATTGYGKYLHKIPASVFASYLVRIKINKQADARYVGYNIESDQYKQFINAHVGGAAQPNANAQILTSYPIPLPPLPTQRKIAAILSAYDDLIENNLRRIKILEEMAQNLYREWFVKFRFPGHEQARFVDSEMGRIPEGWEWVSLGDIIEPKRGKTITKKTIKQGNIPVIAGGLQPAYSHNESNTNNPVITISASGANAGFVNLYHEAVWASDCSYIDSSMTSHVYYFFLLLQYRQIEITGMQRGAAQPHVYPKDLARLCVLKVPDCTLNLFDHHITPAFALIRDLNHKNINLRHTRDLLLPRLISGEVDVSELDISLPNENGL